ncbi:MAG TPA: DUF6178 family protein, partial [Myxococcota bacterium]
RGYKSRMTSEFLELRRNLRQLPAKKRIDAIIERKDALKVVRALPLQDLYATVREVGVEDCLEVLELCSPRQIQGFLDLDGWRGDRIDSASVAVWLRAMFQANPDRAVGQLRGLDLELLTLLVKLHCTVYDLTLEEEPEGDVGLHSITPDQRYLVVYGGVGDDERMQQVMKDALDRLMTRDMLFVLRLCEAVRWELPSSLEDDAFRWRNARLADMGFLPRHDALSVFAWRDPDAPLPRAPPARAPSANEEPDSVSTDLSTSVLFPWDALKDGASALAQATQGLSQEERERVAHEIMLTANRVHCADNGDAGDAEALRATAKQVVDTVGVALSYRCAGDPKKLPEILRSTSSLTLFSIGHSLALKLQRELRARVEARDSGLAGNGVLRLDTPLREVAAGLLRPRPLLYCGLIDEKRVDFRPPQSLGELAALSRAVLEIGFRGALLGPRGLGATDDALAKAGVDDPALQPTHGALLGAHLGRRVLGEAPALTPLSRAELERLRKLLADGGRAAVESFATDAKAYAPLPGAPSADDVQARARAYAAQVMAAMTTELGRLAVDPDPRFIASVWTPALAAQ